MPDLKDGESIEMQGSGSRPYVLKNVGGVYSCSCPAWRNQSVAIERRTCKHLRNLRGDAAEEARVGGELPVRASAPREGAEGPPLLLAEAWDGFTPVAGWWISEKLDGVRAYWDGKQFQSRLGNVFHAPDWFLAGLPDEPLDGELWLARKAFQRTVSIVRRQDKSDLWKEVRYVVFDAPGQDHPFERRLECVQALLKRAAPPYALAHPHAPCRGIDHLRDELAKVEAQGGEGLMLRQPGSHYAAGRSSTLLKVKSFRDAEACVVGHEPGKGRHKGRLGALLVEMADGTRFAVGTGFADAERERPPAVGSVITFRYQELSDAGVPRFPSYVSLRQDAPAAVTPAATPTPTATTRTRRFEFSDGRSNKFWEITVDASEVTVRYGRMDSDGQTHTKSFPDEAAAAAHAAKLIAEKTGKGYRERR
jgi:DNA ligase-1